MFKTFSTATFLTFAIFINGWLDISEAYSPSFYKKPAASPPSFEGGKQTRSTSTSAAFFAIPFSVASVASFPKLPALQLPLPSHPFPSWPQLDRKEVQQPIDKGKEVARQQMAQDAEVSSSLALKFYFQGVGRRHQATNPGDKAQRMNRSCPNGVEVALKAFGGQDCVVCDNNSCRLLDSDITNTSPHHQKRPESVSGRMLDLLNEFSGSTKMLGTMNPIGGSKALHQEMKLTEIDEAPAEVSWLESISRTLSLVGIQNEMDCTIYEGTRYMDVIVRREGNEHLRWDARRGLIVQLLQPSMLRGEDTPCEYVRTKTDALRRGNWEVLSVPALDWAALATDEAKIGWLAVKLAKQGFFQR